MARLQTMENYARLRQLPTTVSDSSLVDSNHA